MNHAFDEIFAEIQTPIDHGIVFRASGKKGNFDSDLVDSPHVFFNEKEQRWLMTYVGHDGTGYSTGVAVSHDLINWQRLGIILKYSGEDGAWDKCNAGGYLIRDHIWGQPPTLHRRNGKIWMPFLASDQPGYEAGVQVIGLATAENLMGPWTKHPNPILTPLDNDLERGAIWKIFVIPINGEYAAFFPAGRAGDGRDAAGHEWICQAYSKDLLHWTREPLNPVLAETRDSEGRIWGRFQTGDCEVFRVGSNWVMVYFTDTPSSISTYHAIDSFAISNDMVHWTPSHRLLLSCNSLHAREHAHKPCIFKYRGVVYHFYCAVGEEGRGIALATSQ